MNRLRSHWSLWSLVLLSSVAVAACGPSPTPSPTLSSISITPASATLQVGGTKQLTVTGTYSDGSVSPLTTGVTWTSGDAAVATVSGTGLVTAAGEGTATITATASGKTATAGITVQGPPPPTLTAIAVAPATATLTAGDTQPLTVTGTYSDSSTKTLTTGVTFASSDDTVATVDATGLVTAVAAGTATITATETASGLTAQSAITVKGAALPGAVFTDDYAADVSFADFGGATNAVSIDTTEHHTGTASLKVEVPATGYTGGALVASSPRDLTAFNALTFWVKASQAATLDVTGLGNDATGSAPYSAELANVPVTPTWTEVVIPLPNPAKAAAISGLFHFAEGSTEGAYTLWFDDIAYTNLPPADLAAATAAAIHFTDQSLAPGDTASLDATQNTVTYATPALTLTKVGFRWFDLTSSDASVATVDADGAITAVADGTATVTAALGSLAVPGSATVTVATAPPATSVVFADDYAPDVSFVDFGGATNVLSVDTTEHRSGTASLKVEVPATNYTGGALVASSPRDLSAFNALTFWVKASQTATLDVTGLGNDGAGNLDYSAELAAVPVSTTWTQYVIPLPDPSKAGAMVGLFHFAESSSEGAYTLWFDDIQYTTLGSADLAAPTAVSANWTDYNLAPGGTAQLVNGPNTLTYATPAETLTKVGWSWFDLTSSDTQVATVDATGVITAVADGTSAITGTLAGLTAPGSATVTVANTAQAPTTAPPAPTAAPADVISLFSSAYTDVPVDTFDASWSSATYQQVTIASEPMLEYTNLDFVGVEFTGANLIDATNFPYFHVDVWTPNATQLGVKLVDFGADGAYGGGDDTAGQILYDASSTPALTQGGWVSLDIPMSDFMSAGLTHRAHLAQLIFSALPTGSATVYVDNIYFHK